MFSKFSVVRFSDFSWPRAFPEGDLASIRFDVKPLVKIGFYSQLKSTNARGEEFTTGSAETLGFSSMSEVTLDCQVPFEMSEKWFRVEGGGQVCGTATTGEQACPAFEIRKAGSQCAFDLPPIVLKTPQGKSLSLAAHGKLSRVFTAMPGARVSHYQVQWDALEVTRQKDSNWVP